MADNELLLSILASEQTQLASLRSEEKIIFS